MGGETAGKVCPAAATTAVRRVRSFRCAVVFRACRPLLCARIQWVQFSTCPDPKHTHEHVRLGWLPILWWVLFSLVFCCSRLLQQYFSFTRCVYTHVGLFLLLYGVPVHASPTPGGCYNKRKCIVKHCSRSFYRKRPGRYVYTDTIQRIIMGYARRHRPSSRCFWTENAIRLSRSSHLFAHYTVF